MGKTLWTSANKKWTIVDETDGIRNKPDWNDGSGYVAMVSASDGWNIAYASITVSGRIYTGDYNTNWEYFVPKTVEAKAFSLLRSLYKEKKQKEMGKSQIPLQYVVIVTGIGKTNKVSYYRTYDTAVKHAEMEWKKLTVQQKKNGAFVNVGRLSTTHVSPDDPNRFITKVYMSSKEVPERFNYNILGSITSTYNSFDKKRRS